MKPEITTKRVFQNLSLLAFLVLALMILGGVAQGEHQLAPERRRPLSRIRNWLRGTDLTIRGIPGPQGGTMAASCQSTPVAKKELESPEGVCRLAYLTAAHCVDSDFRTIEFLGIGEVQKSSMRISIPREYSLSRAAQSREPQRGDSATIVFDVSCEKAKSVVPVPLAPVDSQGTTIINSNRVYLQKRQGQAQGNRGEGAQILADVNGSDGAMYRFYAPSPQGYAIVGGDSGGPIFNEKGQLVCPISGSEYEAKRENGQLTRLPDGTPDKVLDPFTVVCDKKAIARLRADLANFGLAPVSSSEAEDLSQQSQLAQNTPSAPQSASNPRPLFGSLGGGQPGTGTPDENGCINGVCPLPNGLGSQPGQGHSQDTVPGLRSRPQADSATAQTEIPARTSGGMKEVGPVRTSDLDKVLEDAKKKGFKHVVIRYGNDARCKYCRVLAGELRSQFGNDSDVLVIKVEDSVLDQREGIPQSELKSLDENGNWKKQGETHFGAGVGQLYKRQVQALRTRKPQSVPQQKQVQPQEQPQGFTQGSQNPSRGLYNGYQFAPVPNQEGLHYRRPEDPKSEPTGIFLKRMPDGTRRAARREADGTLSFLSNDAEAGLRQFYQANREKVGKLPTKQRQHVEEFLRSSEPSSAPQTQDSPSQSNHSGQGSAVPQQAAPQRSAPQPGGAQLNNRGFRNALPPTTGSVPADHEPKLDLEKNYARSEAEAKDKTPLHSAIGRCIECHTSDSGRKLILPENPDEALKTLAQKLSEHGPINPEMVVKMAESSIHGSLSEAEKQALYQHLFGTTDLKKVATLDEPQKVPPQEMDAQKLADLKKSIPKTTNPFLDSVLNSSSTKFYTDKERPAVYQVDKDTLGAGEGLKFRDTPDNVGRLGWKDLFRQSAETAKVFFRGILGTPAGLQNASDADYKTIKFIRNPTQNGATVPNDVFAIPSGIDSHKIDWKFPEGTVVGEMILVTDPTTGKDRVLQVRTRTKTGANSWQPDIYQAFPTAQSFSDRIKSVYSDGAWQKDPELKRMVEHLEKSSKMPTRSVTSDYAIPVYSGKGGVDQLPDLSPEKVARLLEGATLDSSLNKRWRSDGETESFAPTTKSNFHIVPKNYEAHTLEVSEASCMRCHQNAGTNFGVINPHARRNDGAQFAPPDAYGGIYGRDGIFSWHPFSSDRFSYQNFGNGVQGAKTDNRYDRNGKLMLQPGWIQSGLIRWLGKQK
jgi:hypothetical protein